MSYIHVPHDQPMEHRTLSQLLREQAKAHPNKEAFVFRDTTTNRVSISFQECESKSQSLASGLLHIGLSKGDRVLVLVPSCPEFLYVYLALNRIGAIAIIDEEDSHSTIKIIKNLACVISKTDYQLPLGRQVVQEIRTLLREQESFKAVLISPGNEEDLLKENQVHTYDNLLEFADKNPNSQAIQQAEEKVQMDDPFVILFTSGSTSSPKPIEYTHHSIVNGTMQDGLLLNRRESSRIFNAMPVDWLPGISNISFNIECGSTMILFPPKTSFKGGHTSTILKIIAEEQCTNVVLPPAMIHDITTQGNYNHGLDLSTLRFMEMGGQPTDLSTLRKLFQLLPEVIVIHVYGSTETQVVSNLVMNKDNVDSLELGTFDIRPGFEIKVIDEDDQLVPIGSPGEICARGPWVAFPNFDMFTTTSKEPVQTREQLNNWHHLKDLGCLDSQGRLKVFGRKDDMIKCATESVQPVLVEEIMYQHPDIEKVCVVGVPDQRLYEKICACIIMKAGKQGNQATFDKWAEEHFDEMSLGLKLKPHCYVFVDSFPVTRTGKLSRRSTRDLAIKMLGLA